MNLNRRNYPPEHGIRVPFAQLKTLISGLFEAADMRVHDAQLLADILTRNNQRCLYSHGTGQIRHYLECIKKGDVNPRPEITVTQEAAASLVMDGDGGLGYFPCYHGTRKLIDKARAGGIAAMTTSNHHHVGATGNYTRMAIEHDCIGICCSSYRAHLGPDAMIYNIVDTSPLSIALPAGEQPPLVTDMGGRLLHFQGELFERLPTTYFKVMALTSAVKALGAVFPRVFREALEDSPWKPNQAAFIAVIDIAHFTPIDEFKADMDQFIKEARQSQPLPGMERAELAGGNEWAWERENVVAGIPMSDEHVEALRTEADALGVQTHFEQFESTRF
ncbi:MAG: hypothetical protein HN712_01760 [Gemmatimonadetes bacterium]|jgi:LDH2 family malate/lactate/ureidoglycolate dehydrogenase|nr:hypothetical protein [Gemmatimonadota bacterium]MBT7859000.1 hypothetical protein [Gemmatimonadota bacterium]